MNDGNSSFFPAADMFTRAWSDLASKMMGVGMAYAPESTPPDAARQMRSAMFKAWSEYFDQFMRSADFLDMMKQSMTGSVQARRQMNDFLGQLRHEFQGTSRQDIDQVLASLRQLERRLAEHTEPLADRLDEISRRLDDLERSLQSNGNQQTVRRKRTEVDR